MLSTMIRALALLVVVEATLLLVTARSGAGEAGGARAPGSDAPPVRRPGDWPRVFTERLNAGDLDGVVALYAADARFVQASGETLDGRDAIRDVLAGLVRTRTRMTSEVRKTITVGDVAILYSDFAGTTVDASGEARPMRSRAIEVLRRQPDGAWLLVVGDPNARG